MRGQVLQSSFIRSKPTRLSQQLRVLVPSLIACLLLMEPLLCFVSCPDDAEGTALGAEYDIRENTESTSSSSAAFLGAAAGSISHFGGPCTNCSDVPDNAPDRPHALHAHDHLAVPTLLPIVTLALILQVRALHKHSAVLSLFTAPLLRPPLLPTR
jgi:cytosine/uracil/thiamine/allantoin permease